MIAWLSLLMSEDDNVLSFLSFSRQRGRIANEVKTEHAVCTALLLYGVEGALDVCLSLAFGMLAPLLNCSCQQNNNLSGVR